MWLGRPCRCPMRFKKLHFAPRLIKRFFKNYISITWHSLIFLFCYYPPLKEDETLHFKMFEPPLSKNTLCQVWLKLAKWFSSKRFLTVANVFFQCGYYLPLEKCMALNWTNLNSLYPRILCVMFGWNWPTGSFKSCQYIFNSLLLLTLEKG